MNFLYCNPIFPSTSNEPGFTVCVFSPTKTEAPPSEKNHPGPEHWTRQNLVKDQFYSIRVPFFSERICSSSNKKKRPRDGNLFRDCFFFTGIFVSDVVFCFLSCVFFSCMKENNVEMYWVVSFQSDQRKHGSRHQHLTFLGWSFWFFRSARSGWSIRQFWKIGRVFLRLDIHSPWFWKMICMIQFLFLKLDKFRKKLHCIPFEGDDSTTNSPKN